MQINMQRTKPYDVPHKGLRNALSQLSLLAGKTNYSSPSDIETLYHLSVEVFKILTIHADDENKVTLSELEDRCPGSSEHDLADHVQIHGAQDKLEKAIQEIYALSKSGKQPIQAGADFYLAFSEFHGKYLEHTAEEERVTQPLLWKYFTDDELASQRRKILSLNPPATLLTWFGFSVPALSHNERIGLLGGFKKMAPAAFFIEGMESLKRVLPENEFESLQKDLGN
jgi:hypothetical protein